MSRASPPLGNRILAALAPRAYRRVMAALTPVELALGQALYEPGKTARYVYFPNHCVVSLVAVPERGIGLEVGLVGRGKASRAFISPLAPRHRRLGHWYRRPATRCG